MQIRREIEGWLAEHGAVVRSGTDSSISGAPAQGEQKTGLTGAADPGRQCSEESLTPDLLGKRHYQAELGELILLGQEIAGLSAGEAALRAQSELIERQMA